MYLCYLNNFCIAILLFIGAGAILTAVTGAVHQPHAWLNVPHFLMSNVIRISSQIQVRRWATAIQFTEVRQTRWTE